MDVSSGFDHPNPFGLRAADFDYDQDSYVVALRGPWRRSRLRSTVQTSRCYVTGNRLRSSVAYCRNVGQPA